jgi:hypothetical protein
MDDEILKRNEDAIYQRIDDDFLKRYRVLPNPAFADRLYKQIQGERRSITTMKRFSLALAAVILVALAVVTVSADVRASTLEVIRKIGGMSFDETMDYPGGAGQERLLPSEKIPLAKARLRYPGMIALPEFIPDGYALRPEVELIDLEGRLPMASVNWEKDEGENGWSLMSLWITYVPEDVQDYHHVTGLNSIEEVTVNGKSAALLRGGWNADTKAFDPDVPSLRLVWMYDEHTVYDLHGVVGEVDGDMLIAVAESIP